MEHTTSTNIEARVSSREERAIELEEYAGELKKELTAVEEQIKELKR